MPSGMYVYDKINKRWYELSFYSASGDRHCCDCNHLACSTTCSYWVCKFHLLINIAEGVTERRDLNES